MVPKILCVILLTAMPALAGDTPLDRGSLKGVKAVGVIIDSLPAAFPKEGVTAEALQARLTQRLRDANVPVDPGAKEFIGLRVTSVRSARGPYAASVAIGLYQPVTLVRDPTLRVAPQTWDVDTIILADPKLLSRAAMESVDELADRFISAWRSVNQ